MREALNLAGSGCDELLTATAYTPAVCNNTCYLPVRRAVEAGAALGGCGPLSDGAYAAQAAALRWACKANGAGASCYSLYMQLGVQATCDAVDAMGCCYEDMLAYLAVTAAPGYADTVRGVVTAQKCSLPGNLCAGGGALRPAVAAAVVFVAVATSRALIGLS